MSRRRLAVALMVPPPAAREIDGLRRALGDRQLGRIDPHITIIPPINVHEDAMADALALVDAATSGRRAIEVSVGPVDSFAIDSPVRFLTVEPWEEVIALRDACHVGVLARPERRRFHPHVTIDIDGSPTDRSDPAIDLLSGFRTDVRFDFVTVLELPEPHGAPATRRWQPYLSFRLT